jgi:hypothetical protein
MNMINTEIRTSIVMCIACVTLTSIVFGFLVKPQFLYAQGEANETFFEMTMREATQTNQPQNTSVLQPTQTNETMLTNATSASSAPAGQQNQTAAAPAAAPTTAAQQNQTAAAPAAAPTTAAQQNQTAAAPAAAPTTAAQQNQTAPSNPLEQLGQAISKLFGGGK